MTAETKASILLVRKSSTNQGAAIGGGVVGGAAAFMNEPKDEYGNPQGSPYEPIEEDDGSGIRLSDTGTKDELFEFDTNGRR